jgi:hypothetical protein
MSFVFSALPMGEPDQTARARVVVADAPNSYPCRRCLRDAEVGERLLLLPYDPFGQASPYTGEGPIFVHAQVCTPHSPGDEVPDQVRRRLVSVRGYDADGMLTGAEVVEGADLEPVLDGILAEPGTAYAHLHYARPGCFACRVDRGGRPPRAAVALPQPGIRAPS